MTCLGHGKNDSRMCCWCVLERDDKYGWKVTSSFNDWWTATRRNVLRINKSHLGLNALHWFRAEEAELWGTIGENSSKWAYRRMWLPKVNMVLGCRIEECSPEWEGHSPMALCTLSSSRSQISIFIPKQASSWESVWKRAPEESIRRSWVCSAW